MVNVGRPRDELKKHIKSLLGNFHGHWRILAGESPKYVSTIAGNNSPWLAILEQEIYYIMESTLRRYSSKKKRVKNASGVMQAALVNF